MQKLSAGAGKHIPFQPLDGIGVKVQQYKIVENAQELKLFNDSPESERHFDEGEISQILNSFQFQEMPRSST